MKKKLLPLVICSLMINASCASIMTSRGEKKEFQVTETRILEKKLINSEIKPEYEAKNNTLKIKLIAHNTYSADKEEIIKFRRDIGWVWGGVTFGIGAIGSLAAPVWDENQTKTLLTVGGIALGVTAIDYLFTLIFKEGTDKNIIKTPDFPESKPVPNAKVSINISGKDFKSTTDKEGIFYTTDINYKELDNNSSSKLTVNYESKEYSFDVKTAEIWELLAYNDPEYVKKPKVPPILDASVHFIEPSGSGFLNANEEGFIKVKVTNFSKADAVNLNVKITGESDTQGLVFASSTKIRKIVSNKSEEIIIPIKASKNMTDKNISLKIEVTEPFYGADADPVKISFQTRALKMPDLEVAELGLEDEIGGKFTLGKETAISAIIRNKGKGKAENVTAIVNISQPNVSYITENQTFELGTLEPGAWKKITFSIFANKKYSDEEIPFKIFLSETRTEQSKSENLKIAVNKPISKINELVFNPANEEKEKPVVNQALPSINIDVDTYIPKTNNVNKEGIAVIIGNKDYQNKDIPTVDYAIRDSKVIKEYVKNVLGYKEENIIYLENANQGDFIKLFGNKENYRGKLSNFIEENKSDVFIYYSGHGAPDPATNSAYFVPADTDPSTLALNGYSLETFYSNLGKLNAKNITVVLDSCFSGGSEKGMVIKKASPIFIDVKNSFKISENMSVLTSSTGEQISSWYEDKKHSLFTYYFLKALQLGNKGDEDGDIPSESGNITLSDIHKYISLKVKKQARRMYGREQSPQLITKDSKKIFVSY